VGSLFLQREEFGFKFGGDNFETPQKQKIIAAHLERLSAVIHTLYNTTPNLPSKL
jgi:hypothetical protein